MKTSKQGEVFQIRSNKKSKILPAISDPSGIFTDQILTSFEKEISITVCLVAFEQKDYLFKILINEKLDRLNFLKL